MDNRIVSDGETISTITKKSAWTEDQHHEMPCMKKLLSPFLLSLSITGCYSFTDMNKNVDRKRVIKSTISRTYRMLVLLAITLYLAKCIAAFFYISKTLVLFNGLVVVWLCCIVATFLVFLKASSIKYGHIEEAFIFWQKNIIPEFNEMEIKFPTSSMRRKIMVVAVVAWIVVVLNMTGTGVQIYFGGPELLTSPFGGSPATITVAMIVSFYASCVWVFPTFFVVMISKLLYETIHSYNKFSSVHCTKEGCHMADDIQRVRLLHANLCKLVNDLDGDLSWFYASSFTFSIGIAVFTLYQIMKTDLSTYELILFLFWFCSQLAIATMLAIYAAFVNDEAHAPLDTIYHINVKDITLEKLTQLNLYLSKLTGTQVGFTVCGLLVITKEFILTISGVFLTYFAVLYTL
ncbi:hypothetical protein ACF0H5_003236 [Mactra antiquata]